jgi:hypothetical protein
MDASTMYAISCQLTRAVLLVHLEASLRPKVAERRSGKKGHGDGKSCAFPFFFFFFFLLHLPTVGLT